MHYMELTKRLEKKLDGNYTRMLRAIVNKSWREHPTKKKLYDHLSPFTKAIQFRRTRHAGHCWRSRDEHIYIYIYIYVYIYKSLQRHFVLKYFIRPIDRLHLLYSMYTPPHTDVIYEALCFDVAQGRLNGAPNETRTHSCRFASQACEPLHYPRCPPTHR